MQREDEASVYVPKGVFYGSQASKWDKSHLCIYLHFHGKNVHEYFNKKNPARKQKGLKMMMAAVPEECQIFFPKKPSNQLGPPCAI